MEEKITKPATGTALLTKALNIIELVEQQAAVGRLTASEIAKLTSYPKSTVYRILQTLVDRGYLRLDSRDHAYELGERFSIYSRHHILHTAINAAAHPLMVKLSSITGETVTLGVLEQRWVRILSRIDSAPGAQPQLVNIGPTRPLHCTSLGKALLAWQPETRLDGILENLDFEAITKETITDRSLLKKALTATREKGHAVDQNEIISNVTCVGVPILDDSGEARAALSISAPSSRMPSQRIASLAEELVNAATAIHQQTRPFTASDPQRDLGQL